MKMTSATTFHPSISFHALKFDKLKLDQDENYEFLGGEISKVKNTMEKVIQAPLELKETEEVCLSV